MSRMNENDEARVLQEQAAGARDLWEQLALISSDHSLPYRPSADLLLTSLALVAGRRTIAVILSGGGSDGATGAVALHDFGGTVIAADEASSRYFGMPEAAMGRDDAVDHVLPVGDIPGLLISLTRATRRRSTALKTDGRVSLPVFSHGNLYGHHQASMVIIRRWAAAAGVMARLSTSRVPTTWAAPVTVRASTSRNISPSRPTGTPRKARPPEPATAT
jgi:CheB methylesterase